MPDKAHAARLRKMQFAMRRAGAHLPAHLPALFTLTDPPRTPDLIGLAGALPSGSGLIYRHFGAQDRISAAFGLAAIARRRALVLLIANDPHLALRVRANGVHWPELQMRHARKWFGAFELMTCAAHTYAATLRAANAGFDAALVSAVFPSNSKSASAPLGPLKYRQLARDAGLPIYALGGVNAQNAQKIADFGGLAAIEGSLDVFWR